MQLNEYMKKTKRLSKLEINTQTSSYRVEG